MFENKRIEVLNKVIGTGMVSSYQFLRMSTADLIYSIPSLKASELRPLMEIQNAVREGNLFECLCGKDETNEQSEY